MLKIFPNPLFISAVPDSVQEGTYLAVIPKGITSKQDLFSVYRKELKFPGYFNPASWDSFDECLRVLESIEEKTVMIAHEDLPFAAREDDLRIYLDVLEYCAAFNESYLNRKLIVMFPQSVREKVDEVYTLIRHRELSQWVTAYDISAFTFVRPADRGRIPEDCDLLMELPSGVRNRQELIAAIRSIDPWLFGKATGWLGVREGLGVGVGVKHMCIMHEDLPLESDEEELKCYLDILLTVKDIGTRTGYTKFDAFFPNYAEEQIRRCISELQIKRERWANGEDLRSS